MLARGFRQALLKSLCCSRSPPRAPLAPSTSSSRRIINSLLLLFFSSFFSFLLFPFFFIFFFYFFKIFELKSNQNQKINFVLKILFSKGAFSPANGHFIFRPRLRRGPTQLCSAMLSYNQQCWTPSLVRTVLNYSKFTPRCNSLCPFRLVTSVVNRSVYACSVGRSSFFSLNKLSLQFSLFVSLSLCSLSPRSIVVSAVFTAVPPGLWP